jgi:type I restriction enzyme M protein
MPPKRQVLDLLIRDELIRLVDRHGVIVGDRRQKAHLAERLDEKAPALAELLADLSRDRLKEICRALGLDDSGKEKAAILARIAGEKAPSQPPAKPARANGAPQQIELPLGEKLTIDKLERYLWSAADILRGSIDSADYKNYIFGLLFLKRLSDRFDEECESLVAAGDDPEDRDNHPFYVPKRARWPSVRRRAAHANPPPRRYALRLSLVRRPRCLVRPGFRERGQRRARRRHPNSCSPLSGAVTRSNHSV